MISDKNNNECTFSKEKVLLQVSQCLENDVIISENSNEDNDSYMVETEEEVHTNWLAWIATTFVPPNSVATKIIKERKKVMAPFDEILHDTSQTNA